MANRMFNTPQCLATGKVLLAGVIQLHTDASVLTTTNFPGATVTKTGTGEYTITLRDKYVALMSCQAQFGAASAVDMITQVGAVDVSSARTIVIRTQVANTPTNVSAASQIYVSLALKNSTVS